MNKLEATIKALPDEYNVIRNVMLNLLESLDLASLRLYTLGLRDMALHLTSDEVLLDRLTEIRGLLK